jgi:16S rRNA (cytosine1402-N4)-methyltransferase
MMPGRGPGHPEVAGGPVRHIPVLARAAIDCLSVRADGVYLDGTFGAGGYTRLILATPGARVVAIDRDHLAVAAGAGLVADADGRLVIEEDAFSRLDAVAAVNGFAAVDGVVLDLGVSSMQLDDPQRGFSFRHDGPLDMRMASDGPSAADVIAAASERDLAAVIATLGEERHARAVARAIVRARNEAPIRTTGALAALVARVVRAKPGDIHPATRTFQALRILVNDELGELAHALAAAERILKPGGRLAVVAFHSLEDRIVKTFLTERSRIGGGSRHQPEIVRPAPSFCVLTRRPLTPEPEETAINPRARSAKLRAAERTAAPAQQDDASALLPRVPSLADMLRGG